MGNVLVAIIGLVFAMTLSWGIVVGVVKLITMCFGLTFSLPIATGIWLVMFLLRWVFNNVSSN